MKPGPKPLVLARCPECGERYMSSECPYCAATLAQLLVDHAGWLPEEVNTVDPARAQSGNEHVYDEWSCGS